MAFPSPFIRSVVVNCSIASVIQSEGNVPFRNHPDSTSTHGSTTNTATHGFSHSFSASFKSLLSFSAFRCYPRRFIHGYWIYTCRQIGVNPFDYLTVLLRHHQTLSNEPGRWLPWNYKKTVEALPP